MSREPAQRRPRLGAEEDRATNGRPIRFPRPSATTTSNAGIRASATSCRATSRRAPPKQACDEGRGVGETRPGGLSRFQGGHPAPRCRGHQGAIRQPVRDVRADHRRRSLQGSDAHLPRHPLHDGRSVGGLQPDEHDPGAVRARRSELLRSRRQPPRRQRADAGARRRLFHRALHRRQLPRRRNAGKGHDRPRGVQGGCRQRPRAHRQSARRQGQATVRQIHRAARPHHVGQRRHGAQRGGPATRRWRKIRTLRDEFWQDVVGLGRDEQPQPDARLRRPRRRLHGVRRAARRSTPCIGTNRAAATSARSSRRPTAKRCATTSSYRYVAAWEFKGVGRRRRFTRSRWCSTKCIPRSGVTSDAARKRSPSEL